MTPEIENKIAQEANWRSTNGHGGVDQFIHHNFTQGAEYGYSLAKAEMDKKDKWISYLQQNWTCQTSIDKILDLSRQLDLYTTERFDEDEEPRTFFKS